MKISLLILTLLITIRLTHSSDSVRVAKTLSASNQNDNLAIINKKSITLIEYCDYVNCIIYAQDLNTQYLGITSQNQFDSESIINDFGDYGSEFINGSDSDPNLDSEFKPISEPLVDKGLDLSEFFNYDLDGILRPQGLAWDIGAYEYTTATAINSDPTKEIRLLQNYPNPFKSNTSIAYSLPENSDVDISLYNVTGRKVQTLYEGHQIAGEHTLDVELNNIEAGVFFFKLEAGTYKSINKCIINH